MSLAVVPTQTDDDDTLIASATTGPVTPLSPARQRLAEQQASIERLKVEVGRFSKPVDRLRDQLERANQQVAAAEAELSAVDANHSKAIASAARDGTTLPSPPAREKLLARVEETRRNSNAVAMAMPECVSEFQRASHNLHDALTQVDLLTLQVLVEEHGACVDRWIKARDAFIAAEADMKGLLEAISARGRKLEAEKTGSGVAWLQAWEARKTAWGSLPNRDLGPEEIRASIARWFSLWLRLQSDSRAIL